MSEANRWAPKFYPDIGLGGGPGWQIERVGEFMSCWRDKASAQAAADGLNALEPPATHPTPGSAAWWRGYELVQQRWRALLRRETSRP